MVHARPGRLKRPLSADDDLGPHDIAFRKYRILERDMSSPDTLRVRVARVPGSDVFLDLADVFVQLLLLFSID